MYNVTLLEIAILSTVPNNFYLQNSITEFMLLILLKSGIIT